MPDTILLVEDSPEAVELTKHALEECSVLERIVVANDGQDAIDYLFAAGKYSGRDPGDLPEIVLLDLRLPKADGFEVLSRIRANKRTKFVPVVMLTVSKLREDVKKAYELGANSYITKAIDYDVYLETIKLVCAYWLDVNQKPY